MLSALLYGAEWWKITATIRGKLEVFQTLCRCILKIYWPITISNKELSNRSGMDTLEAITHTRRWRWIGNVCRMPPNSITRTALRWTPQGKRKRGRPIETWRCIVENDINISGLSLVMAQRASADRARWKSLAVATRARRRRDELVCPGGECLEVWSFLLSCFNG